MPEDDLLKLAEDIKKHGLKESVVLYDGQVLDGWHRCQACQIAGVEIRTRELSIEADPVAYVISKNAHRRHLTESQRAMAIVRCHEWMPPHRPENKGDRRSPLSASNEVMAEEADVSVRTIQRAKAAERRGRGDDVRDGRVSAREVAQPDSAPKPPTKLEKLEGELATARAQIAHLEESIDDLTDEINLKDWAQLDKNEQVIELEKAQVRIRTLESQCREWQAEAAQWKRHAKGLEKRLG